MKNNSGFVGIKFNFFLIPCDQMVDLNVLFQSFFSFKTFMTKFSKETLAATLVFQCNFS